MNRRRWFLHFLGRSLAQRKGRVAVASVSVTIATAIVVSSLGLSLGIRQKLGGELKAYGANVMVTPGSGHLDEDLLSRIAGVPGVQEYSGQFYSPVGLNGVQVEMIGLDPGDVAGRGWKLAGRLPGNEETLIGVTLRDALDLSPGDMVTLGSGRGEVDARVSGVVETGGPEDTSVIVSLGLARRLAGREGELGAVLLRVETGEIEKTVQLLRERFPGLEVKTLRQVAYAEEAFLGKIELLMTLVTLVVLLASSISVSSTMSATVLERIKEIGLMRAIGGTRRGIRSFYLAEGCAIGSMGGIAGSVVGLAAAQAVSKGAFGSYISVPFYLTGVSLAMGVFIAVSASLVPLHDALRYRASSILRGE